MRSRCSAFVASSSYDAAPASKRNADRTLLKIILLAFPLCRMLPGAGCEATWMRGNNMEPRSGAIFMAMFFLT